MLEDPNGIMISFCLPTYNRAELAKRCVIRILEIEEPRVEVVVSNNNSTDDTEEVIRSICDDRISYYRNQSNIGGTLNIVESIKRAKGEWLFLISDEDLIDVDGVERLIKEISMGLYSAASILMGNVKWSDGTYFFKYGDATYLKGDEAIVNLGFSHTYMSGMLIRKDCIDTKQLNAYTLEDGVYPHINLSIRACLKGDAVTRNIDVCIACKDFEGRVSYFEKQNGQFYFQPSNRFEQFRTFSGLVNDAMVNKEMKVQVLERLFVHYLHSATYGWKYIINDQATKRFYGVDDGVEFDLRGEANSFYSKVMEHFNSIEIDPEALFLLRKKLTKHMRAFKRNMLLRAAYDPMPEPIKNVPRYFYNRMKK